MEPLLSWFRLLTSSRKFCCFGWPAAIASYWYFASFVYMSDISIIAVAGHLNVCLFIAIFLIFMFCGAASGPKARSISRGLGLHRSDAHAQPRPRTLFAISIASASVGRGLAMPAGYDDGLGILLSTLICVGLASYSHRTSLVDNFGKWNEASRRAGAKKRADLLLEESIADDDDAKYWNIADEEQQQEEQHN